jgi:hypothetical protein
MMHNLVSIEDEKVIDGKLYNDKDGKLLVINDISYNDKDG